MVSHLVPVPGSGVFFWGEKGVHVPSLQLRLGHHLLRSSTPPPTPSPQHTGAGTAPSSSLRRPSNPQDGLGARRCIRELTGKLFTERLSFFNVDFLRGGLQEGKLLQTESWPDRTALNNGNSSGQRPLSSGSRHVMGELTAPSGEALLTNLQLSDEETDTRQLSNCTNSFLPRSQIPTF